MNTSTIQDEASAPIDGVAEHGAGAEGSVVAEAFPNGEIALALDSSPQPSIEDKQDAVSALKGAQDASDDTAMAVDDEEAPSEAETVLTSPVKKRETQKQQGTEAKVETPLTVQSNAVQTSQDLDEDADAPGSPDNAMMIHSRVQDSTNSTGSGKIAQDAKSEQDAESESSSDMSPARSFRSYPESRASPKSRTVSEEPDAPQTSQEHPNPRKRKHRASSAGLPSNKRRSGISAAANLKKMHTEDGEGVHPMDSPPPARHRRAVSTQSAFMDGSSEISSSRSRRAATQYPARPGKASTRAYDESSVSSEATSYGQGEKPGRMRRGVGRSTSTAGRPPGGRKRHVNRYGHTKVAEAADHGDLVAVKQWLEKDPEQLDIADNADNTPLQIAALKGHTEVVEYLINLGCRTDCVNIAKDSPLIDAAENGHLDVVKVLLQAGVDPTRQNRKGDSALDVVDEDKDHPAEIRATLMDAIEKWKTDDDKQRCEEEEQHRYPAGPAKELHFMTPNYANLMNLVGNNDRTNVQEFLIAGVKPDNVMLAAAAKTGDTYLLNMLLAEMTEKKRFDRPHLPMINALGTSHFEMVKMLTELEQFDPLFRDEKNRSWPQVADVKRGPMWKQEVELLQRLRDEAVQNPSEQRSSPSKKRESNRKRDPVESEEHSGDAEEEEFTPQPLRRRTVRRRLLSRKDMLAANGKTASDSSSDGESDVAVKEDHDEQSMKPPASPKAKRGVGRPRTKSSSGPPAESVKIKPRRRSSGVREKAEPVLPIVDEQMEDADAEGEIVDQPIIEATAEIPMEIDGVFSNNAKVEPLDDKARAQDEQAQKSPRHDRTDEIREAEVARAAEQKRQDEEASQAEEMRMAAEQHEQQRRAVEKAQLEQREKLIAALPPALACIFATSASPQDHDRILTTIRKLFSPFDIVRCTSIADGVPTTEDYVLNAQIAPFLTEGGLDVLNSPSAEVQPAYSWTTLPLQNAELRSLEFILPGRVLTLAAALKNEPIFPASQPFEEYVARMSKRTTEQRAAFLKLSVPQAPFEPRWVKLSEVRERLASDCKNVDAQLRIPWYRTGEPPSRDNVAMGDAVQPVGEPITQGIVPPGDAIERLSAALRRQGFSIAAKEQPSVMITHQK